MTGQPRRSPLALIGMGEAQRKWAPLWQIAVCAAFVALTLVAINVDIPVYQRILGWVAACSALGLAVGVISGRHTE